MTDANAPSNPPEPEPDSPEPSSPEPSTNEPSSPEPSTPEPSTNEPSSPEPSSPEPSTNEPSSPEPSTPEPSSPAPSTPEPSTPEPSGDFEPEWASAGVPDEVQDLINGSPETDRADDVDGGDTEPSDTGTSDTGTGTGTGTSDAETSDAPPEATVGDTTDIADDQPVPDMADPADPESSTEAAFASASTSPPPPTAGSGPVLGGATASGPGPNVYGPAPGAHLPTGRRLFRSTSDRRLGGLCGGIAEYFDTDPTLVRLITFLSWLTGIGFVAYLAAWIIVPERPYGYVYPVGPPTADRSLSIALGIGALALAFGAVSSSWFVFALALIIGGIWLLSEHTIVKHPPLATYQPAPPYAAGSPSQPTAAPAGVYAFAGQDPRNQQTASTPPPAAPLPPQAFSAVPPTPAPKKEKRARQKITWSVLALLGLLTTVSIVAGFADWWDVHAPTMIGIGAILVAGGVVLGQIRGDGARGLIPLGLLSGIVLLVGAVVGSFASIGVGEVTFRPADVAELQTNYEHGIGSMVVDLSDLDFEGRTETVNIDLGVGELTVIVPEEADGVAIVETGAGELRYWGNGSDSGLYFDEVGFETIRLPLRGDTGTLVLNIELGVGTTQLRSE